MSTSSTATASRKTKDISRPALPILLYDLGAASQLLPTAVVLPEQFYTRPTGCDAQYGETALMRAVLEDAIHCFQKQFVRKGRRVLRLAREAEEWLVADDPRWPFSFVNICAVLGLEPEYLRLGLKQWRERQEAYAGETEAHAGETEAHAGETEAQAKDALEEQPAAPLSQRSLQFAA